MTLQPTKAELVRYSQEFHDSRDDATPGVVRVAPYLKSVIRILEDAMLSTSGHGAYMCDVRLNVAEINAVIAVLKAQRTTTCV